MSFHEFVLHSSAGTLGSVAGVFVGAPLDVIKTRLQNAGGARTAAEALMSAVRSEGASALLKGSLVSAVGQAPNNMIVWGAYGSTLSYLARVTGAASDTPGSASQPQPMTHLFLAGTWAGLLQTIVLAPVEHIKVQQQLYLSSRAGERLSVREAARRIYSKLGARGLFRGWAATVQRDSYTYGCYFVFYEWLKRQVLAAHASLNGRGAAVTTGEDGAVPHWAAVTAGGAAGALTWIIATPADVVKTLIQGAPLDTPRAQLRMAAVAGRLYQVGGLAAFFRGVGPSVLRSVPVNAVTFAGYEAALTRLKPVLVPE